MIHESEEKFWNNGIQLCVGCGDCSNSTFLLNRGLRPGCT
jgi:hypothetical protein